MQSKETPEGTDCGNHERVPDIRQSGLRHLPEVHARLKSVATPVIEGGLETIE